MMNGHWAINQNILVIEDDAGTIESLSAMDIYAWKVKGKGNPRLEEVEDPESVLDKLSFSKVACNYGLLLTKGNEGIELSTFVGGSQDKRCISPLSVSLSDHIILDDTWHYIQNCDSIQDLLRKCGLEKRNRINVAEYIKLVNAATRYADVILEDETDQHPDCVSTNTEVPSNISASLYPYQETGYKWLEYMTEQKCGCILADEMGLGKTLQIIALIAKRQSVEHGHYLVIAPVSLLENWKREFQKFSKGISVYVHHGYGRRGDYEVFLNYDVTVTSYGTIGTDLSMFQMVDWDLAVLDEAQNIKNPESQRTRNVKSLSRRMSISVTGTPFENHITDLWSLMDFSLPGAFGKLTEFESEITDDIEGAKTIEKTLTPMMLRRKVKDVGNDLPDRVDIDLPVTMDNDEAGLYEQIRQDTINEYGGKAAPLVALQKLRMYCTHPSLLGYGNKESSKFAMVSNLINEIASYEEKMLLFTSYNGMFPIFEQLGAGQNIPTFLINGSTPVEDRQRIIDRFSDVSGAALMVLNPRAAGVGLNITAANRVIHYNPEWNPALEDQASARSYRRGQERNVFIYHVFYANTVEEVINDRVEHKRNMFSTAIVGVDGKSESEDITRALLMSPGWESQS